ncbi:hypothetical protein GGF50DRAFT_51924 [Schizophyllum commune]
MHSEKETMRLETQAGAIHSVQASAVPPLDDIWSDEDLEVLTAVAEAGQPRLGKPSAGMKTGGQAVDWEADLAGDILDLADDTHDLIDVAFFDEESVKRDREQWRLGGDATKGYSTVLWHAEVFARDEGLLSDSDDVSR